MNKSNKTKSPTICPFCEEQVNRFKAIHAGVAESVRMYHLKCARTIELIQDLTARLEKLEPKAGAKADA